MDIKTKYHYTYFINPFVIDENKYENFLFKFIKEKKWKLRIFDKITDMEIYTHFLSSAKEMMFPSFYWSDKYKDKIKNLKDNSLAKELSKQRSVEFVYDINDFNIIQGKVDSKNQIFFEIKEIKIICFNSGICFLSFKAVISDNDYISFRDLLNFNYKFKDLSSSYLKYKSNNNIYIQTNQFENLLDISTFIENITAGYIKKSNDEIYSDKMFVYSYACIDEDYWNNEKTFDNIKDNFYKYVFQFSGDYNSEIELSEKEKNEAIYSKWKYSKYGFTKLGGVVFCSAVDHFNFTKLPIHFEKVSYYVMLLAFYERLALILLNNELSSFESYNIKRVLKNVNKELMYNKYTQISNSEHGMSLWKNWRKVFEIDELYKQLDKQYFSCISKINNKNKDLLLLLCIFIQLLIYFILIIRM